MVSVEPQGRRRSKYPSAQVPQYEDREPAKQHLTPTDREARTFALPQLSHTITTLERGILRLKHVGLASKTSAIQRLWARLLTEFVKTDYPVAYEPAARIFESRQARAEHLAQALDETGMAFVMAEAMVARWEWVPLIDGLRREIGRLYEFFGWRLPEREG